jgi:K(+)-stimulated pyrophosphate-energized sodium pump
VLAVYAVVVFGLLTVGVRAWQSGAWFVLGATLSLLAGFVGMKAATFGNVRTAQAASTGSKADALLTALDGGAVMGLCVAGLALIGLFAVYYVYPMGDAHAHAALASMRCTRSRWARAPSRSSRASAAASTPRPPTWAPTSPARSRRTSPRTTPATPASSPTTSATTSATSPAWAPTSTSRYVAAVVAAMALGLTAQTPQLATLLADSSVGNARALMLAVALPLLLATIGLAVSIVGIFITRAMKQHAARPWCCAPLMVLPPFLVTGARTAVCCPCWGLAWAP